MVHGRRCAGEDSKLHEVTSPTRFIAEIGLSREPATNPLVRCG
jgi:hypothetical protein